MRACMIAMLDSRYYCRHGITIWFLELRSDCVTVFQASKTGDGNDDAVGSLLLLSSGAVLQGSIAGVPSVRQPRSQHTQQQLPHFARCAEGLEVWTVYLLLPAQTHPLVASLTGALQQARCCS